MERLLGDLSDTVFLGLVALVVITLLVGLAVIAKYGLLGCRLRPDRPAERSEAEEPGVWPPPPNKPVS